MVGGGGEGGGLLGAVVDLSIPGERVSCSAFSELRDGIHCLLKGKRDGEGRGRWGGGGGEGGRGD